MDRSCSVSRQFRAGLLAVLVAFGCGGGGGDDDATPDETSTGRVATVTIEVPVARVYEGDTIQLTATARDAAGAVVPGKAASWSSGNAYAFPVSSDGVLRTWGVGQVMVMAAIDGVFGGRALTVEPIQVAVTLGAKELVFRSATDSCEPLDLPDHPVRVVRAEDGSLVMFTGNAPRYYASRGADFGTIRRDCSAPVLVSRDLHTPESYENWEWPWVFYRIGSTWHALISNEYHDTFASTCAQGDPSPSNPCWYNSLTHAVSTDGGRTFTKPLAPAHAVAPPPRAWTPPAAGSSPGTFGKYLEGYSAPSSIVHHTDGYYYALMALNPDKNTPAAHPCVMRTSTPGDPASWRAWDGTAFGARMASPYVIGTSATGCAPLPRPVGLASLTYSTYLDRYVALDNMVDSVGGRQVCGFYLQLSTDLVHWSDPTLVVEASIGDCPADPARPGVLEPVEVIFASFIDHSDATVNFERIGQSAYLYYVRFNGGVFDRDVLRVPVTFTRQN